MFYYGKQHYFSQLPVCYKTIKLRGNAFYNKENLEPKKKVIGKHLVLITPTKYKWPRKQVYFPGRDILKWVLTCSHGRGICSWCPEMKRSQSCVTCMYGAPTSENWEECVWCEHDKEKKIWKSRIVMTVWHGSKHATRGRYRNASRQGVWTYVTASFCLAW